MSLTKRIAVSCLLVIALIAIPLTGCPKPASSIDKWGAIDILVTEIIPPAADDGRISAFMPSQPLVKGDVVTSEDGTAYPPINQNTWFIFIDDSPQAFYAHPARYVLINAQTGEYDIYDESWPPLINNSSLWDTASVGRGHLIELWSVLDFPGPIAASHSNAPSADYGDAPDGQDAYQGVVGRYPTLFNTTNSHFGRPGGHTLTIGQETLGFNVSAEVDATDPNDPDGVPNLVDSDSDERIYIITEQNQARLAFTAAVSAGAPDITRYANALIDFDQSGNWGSGAAGKEWVTVNLAVEVDPGTSDTIMTPLFNWGSQTPPAWPVWMRLALTRTEIEESQFANVGGWDGSGQFNYGEIEDYCGFLTDNPPSPPPPPPPPPPDGDGNGDGNGGGGNGAPPPGPSKGSCGYDINYYVLIINCGDCAKHIAQGMPIAQSAASSVTDTTSAQGYSSVANLGPGKSGSSQTNLANIGRAFDSLAGSVKCGDYVLIYICGHGKKSDGGGIRIYDSSGGKTDEMLTPSRLANLLGKIPPCPDEECKTPGKCCHVSVIIESCYAGNFNKPGVTGQGRAVVGTSDDTPSQGVYPGGGVYTAGLAEDMQDPTSDQNTPPDGVDPMEANTSASQAVAQNNKRTGKSQQPWSDSQWCDCKCPCKPGIDVEKWVWDETGEDWVDETTVWPDQTVSFRLDILSSGNCCDIVEMEVVDTLPDCLEYAGEATLYVDSKAYGREPGEISQGDEGLTMRWNLMEIEALAPGESVAIEYEAIAEELGENVNTVYASAHCGYDYSVIVSDQDDASVLVTMPQAQDAPQILLEGYSRCYYTDEECQRCEVTIHFYALDPTGGELPITNLVLSVNGEPLVNLQDISQEFLEDTIVMEAGCGQDIHVELMATNSLGQEQYTSIFGNTTEGELQ
jgi:hypothetical protein